MWRGGKGMDKVAVVDDHDGLPVTHPSLELSWLQRSTSEKKHYPQVPGSIPAENRDLKSA